MLNAVSCQNSETDFPKNLMDSQISKLSFWRTHNSLMRKRVVLLLFAIAVYTIPIMSFRLIEKTQFNNEIEVKPKDIHNLS